MSDSIEELEQALRMLLSSLGRFKSTPAAQHLEVGFESLMSEIDTLGQQAKSEITLLQEKIAAEQAAIAQEREKVQQQIASIKSGAARKAAAPPPRPPKPVVDLGLGQRLRIEVLKEFRRLKTVEQLAVPSLQEWDSWLEESSVMGEGNSTLDTPPPPRATPSPAPLVVDSLKEVSSGESVDAADSEDAGESARQFSTWSNWVAVQPGSPESFKGSRKGWRDVIQ